MSDAYRGEPILLEIDRDGWQDMLDRSERWFGNVLMTQGTFRHLLGRTLEKLGEPHLREYLGAMHERAEAHERVAEELFRSIGREPASFRAGAGRIVSRVREGVADLVGAAGGGTSPWSEIRELQLSNFDAMGAFGVAEQLGFALGLPATARLAFDVVVEKSTDGLLLQEFMLELAPAAILYGEAAWLRGDEAGDGA